MELTNEIVEQYGFKRINNSMWRLGDITLQNGWTHEGENIYERILNTKKAYRACIKGKFYRMIENDKMLAKLVRGQNDDASDSNCTIHIVTKRYCRCLDCGWDGDISECPIETEYYEFRDIDLSYPICPKCSGGIEAG